MATLTHKGFGRIYVEVTSDIERVKEIIKELDEYEFEYLPSNFIEVFTDYPKTRYIGKFSDLDMDALVATCWDRGIRIWVFDSGHEEYPQNKIRAAI